MFIKCLQVGPLPTNCYIACDKVANKAVVIDPGGDAERIIAALDDTGCKAEYVLLTHGHADHMIAAHEVLAATGAKLGVFAGEAEFLNSPDKNCYDMMAQKPFEPFTPDLLLHDGDTVTFGQTELRVMHTPGHTAGSCCYISSDSIFSGDTLFRLSVGRTDLPSGSAADLKKSLERLCAIEGDLQVLTGHGEFTTLDYERQNNPFLGASPNEIIS